MSAKLFGYLGFTESGKLGLYVSTQRLNPIGTRLEKGSLFPQRVYDFINEDDPNKAVSALDGAQKYFDGKEKRTIAPEFGRKQRKGKKEEELFHQ
jgi:hypothetical protein